MSSCEYQPSLIFNYEGISPNNTNLGYSFGKSMFLPYESINTITSGSYFENIEALKTYYLSNLKSHPYSDPYYGVYKFNYDSQISKCDISKNSPLYSPDHFEFYNKYKNVLLYQ